MDNMEKDERISEENLLQALAKEHDVDKSRISLKDWSTSVGSGVVDNFCCEMLAVNGEAVVDGKDQSFNYMVKVEPVAAIRKQMLKTMEFGDKEYQMYNDILPAYNELREEVGLKPLRSPKCYFGNPDPNVIIMENLKLKDFVMRKSVEDGLSEKEIKAYCEELASFHATGYHFIKAKFGNNEAFLSKYPMMEFFKLLGPFTEEMIKKNLGGAISNIDTLAKEYMEPSIADKFAAIVPKLWDIFTDGINKPCGLFRTLTHGDSWANNAMFKHDDNGVVKDLVLFDFQCCRITSPGVDLGYLIVTGTTEEARTPNIEKWLRWYHDQFSTDLDKFGHDAKEVFSFDTLLKDYNEAYPYNFVMAMMHFQALLMNAVVVAKLAEFKSMETTEGQIKALEELKVLMKESIATCSKYRERSIGLIKEAMAKNVF